MVKKKEMSKENLRHARSFRELLVYQKANEVAKDIFEISKRNVREVMSFEFLNGDRTFDLIICFVFITIPYFLIPFLENDQIDRP